jgi:hypothetical protein
MTSFSPSPLVVSLVQAAPSLPISSLVTDHERKEIMQLPNYEADLAWRTEDYPVAAFHCEVVRINRIAYAGSTMENGI